MFGPKQSRALHVPRSAPISVLDRYTGIGRWLLDEQVNGFAVVWLSCITERLLMNRDQDDGVAAAPWLPSQGDRGSCTLYISVDLSCHRFRAVGGRE
jgi:hypothetical protein